MAELHPNLTHSEDLLDLFVRTVEGTADPDVRNEHLYDAAGDLAAVGMADLAMGLLHRIDDVQYRCIGWVGVALALARLGHPEAPHVVTDAAALMDETGNEELVTEIAAELAVAGALVGQRDLAIRQTELVLPKMLEEPYLGERAEIAALLVEAAQAMGHCSDVMDRAKATAMAEIVNAFTNEKADWICGFQLEKILPTIRHMLVVENLLFSTADRVVAGIGASGHSPIFAASSLMELAHGAAKAGEVRSAYLVAKKALDLRHRSDIRHPIDFCPSESYFRFANFFCVSAAALAKAGDSAQSIAALKMAEAIGPTMGDAEGLSSMNRRLRSFDALLAMRLFDQARAELNRAELACYRWWEDDLRRGWCVDSPLYSLAEIAVGWINLDRLPTS